MNIFKCNAAIPFIYSKITFNLKINIEIGGQQNDAAATRNIKQYK